MDMDIQKKMKKLARIIHKLAKKHGDIYIAAVHTEGAGYSWTSWSDIGAEKIRKEYYQEQEEDE